MYKKHNKVFCMIMAFLMLFSTAPSSVFADEVLLPEEQPQYHVIVQETENGNTILENGEKESDFYEGEAVTFDLSANEGYQYAGMIVSDANTAEELSIPVELSSDGTSGSLTMPAEDIIIQSEFELVEEPGVEIPEETVVEEVTQPESSTPEMQSPEAEEPEQVEVQERSDEELPEIVVQAETNGTLNVQLTEGGTVSVKAEEDLFQLNKASENPFTVTDPDTGIIYDLSVTKAIGTPIEIEIIADEGYKISEYRVMTDSGEVVSTDAVGLKAYSATVINADMQTLSVSFEKEDSKQDLYELEDCDYSQYQGLDFSTGRLIVGTFDPSIFVDQSVIISELNGLYLLQFEDAAVAMKAYAYYQDKASIVEIDGKAMAVNDDEHVEIEIPVDDIMTEDANPFTEAQEAMAQTGDDSFDIAIIDTGVNGYATTAVSVIGDDAADDNGHGTNMAALIKEQNPNASILSIKAFEGDGLADLSAVYAAFQYALTQNVDIIHISASAITTDSTLLAEAINSAVASGTIVVASAGNNGKDASWFIPAGMAGVVTIGACDANGKRLASSNYGSAVEYNVVADSTSEAAAKFTGWISANGLDAVEAALGQGLIYAADYDPDAPIAEDDILNQFRAMLNIDTTKDEIVSFVSALTVPQAQALYAELTNDEFGLIWNIFHKASGLELTYENGEISKKEVLDLFHINILTVDSTPGGHVIIVDGSSNSETPIYPFMGHQFGGVNSGYAQNDEENHIYYNAWLRSIPYGVVTASGSFNAYCVQALQQWPVGDYANGITKMDKTDETTKTLIKLYLVSPYGPLYETYRAQIFDNLLYYFKLNGCFGATGEDMSTWDAYADYCMTHMMMSGVYSGEWTDTATNSITGETFVTFNSYEISLFQQAIEWVKANVPETSTEFKNAVGYMVKNPVGTQDVFWIEFPTNGSVSFATSASNANGKLTVSKTVRGQEGLSDTFNFKLNVNGSLQNTFSLSSGSSRTFDIPAGATYSVTEDAVLTANGNQKYKVTKSGDSGTMGSGSTSQSVSYKVTGLPSGSFPVTGATTTSVSNNGTITAVAGSTVTIKDIPDGTNVTVTETTPSGSNGTWSVNQTVVSGTVVADTNVAMGKFTFTFTPSAKTTSFINENQIGYLYLTKESQADEWCTGNSLYSIAGAEYEVYSSSNLSASNKVATLKTKADGTTDTIEVIAGTYYVVETKASPGHKLDPRAKSPKSIPVEVTTANKYDNPATITSTDPVLNDPLHITINKVSEPDYKYSLPLTGVKFKVSYYDNLDKNVSGTPLRTWIIETKENNGKYVAILDDAYLSSDNTSALYKLGGNTVLPIGTYGIEELSSIPGYTKEGGFMYANADQANMVPTDNGVLAIVVKNTNEDVSISVGNEYTGQNKPVRIDTEAMGTASGSKEYTHYLDGSLTYGVVVDTITFKNLEENGEYRLTGQLYDRESKEPFGYSVVKYFTATQKDDMTTTIKFGVTDLDQLAGHVLVVGETLEQKINGEWTPVGQEIDLENEKQSVHVTKINTTLTDDQTQNHVAVVGESTFTDTVEYVGLIEGAEYTLKAELKNQETGRTVATAEKTFSASGESGTETVTFEYTPEEAKTYVAFEELYVNNTKITSHRDLDDEAQTVHAPKIRTVFTDSVDGAQDALASDTAKLVDTVSYENLIPGITYQMSAVLMNKDQNEPVINGDGNAVTASAEFVPEEYEGTVDVTFEFDATKLAGEDIVAFETLMYQNIPVAEHKDINDASQTIELPRIATVLVDTKDEQHDALAEENIVLQDTVEYENLIVGKEYTVQGVLMDQKTGEEAKDDNGQSIVSETSFVAETPNGSIVLTFTFSGVKLAGESLVAFETISTESKTVAIHADINDAPQTVDIPEVETTLKDSVDMDDDADATTTIKLIDNVRWNNLLVGRNYTVSGKLMDKDTGKPALDDNGQEITAEVEFVPETKSGSTDLVFEFSGVKLAGKSVVAFEELRRDDKLVGVHADIEDEEQTVHIPEIKTTLVDTIDAEHDALADTEMKLVDHVTYKNLLPGRTYKVTGKLYDQETNAPALDDAGKEITAEETFTAEEADGVVDITFTFEGLKLEGHSVVAFEDLYRGEKHVAVHADIQDASQTVNIPKIRTELKDSFDGEHDALAQTEIVLQDTITYENLIPGKSYTATGKLYDMETGDPALDDAGNEITGETAFVPAEKNGTVVVTFKFSGLNLAGKSVVAFEDLYTATKKVAVHADLNDEPQKVDIPEIGTTLVDTIDLQHDALAQEDIHLIDTVAYKNLLVGRTYTVRGLLMDKATGEPAIDDHGEQISSEATFVAEAKDGSVEIEFVFDGLSLDGHTVVAFERLFRDEKLVALHADLDDFDQSVFIPRIETSLVDDVDGTHDADATDHIVLVDTVHYYNLFAGQTYTAEGKLMDQETGAPALDDEGNEITATAEFIPDAPDGSVELTFTFSGISLAGRSVVAFEDVFHNEKKVAVHADLSDESQTVHLPKIETVLVDSIDQEKDAFATEEIILNDTVKYENLFVGETYKVTGILMDQETGEPALDDNGEQITGETEFTAETVNGEVEVVFTFSGLTLAGHSLVAFEDLYRGEKHLAVHAEIEDEEQTVYIPEIHTTLKDQIDDDNDAYATEEIVLIDEVFYNNLIVGKEYTLTGTLMDQETAQPAVDDNGDVITSSVTFVAEEPNGSVDVEFRFSGISLAGHTVVAFEDLFTETKQVAVHADLEDESQTVYIPKIRTTLTETKTKLHNAMQGDKITLTDVVEYWNIIPGKNYTILGRLVNQETGEPVLNKDGMEVTASATFTAETPDGTVDLEFVMDKVPAEGMSVVAFEELYKNPNTTPVQDDAIEEPVQDDQDIDAPADDADAENPDDGDNETEKVPVQKLLASHTDLSDANQTVGIPGVKTTLTAPEGLKTINGYRSMTLYDKVVYTNVYPGQTYHVEGTLMDKETGKAVIDAKGNQVTASADFIAKEKNGEITLKFVFEAPEYIGKQIVAFEKLYEGDVLIADHSDMNDQDQTVNVLKIQTIAANANGTKTFESDFNNKVLDKVLFSHLEVGKEYILHGTLMDKATGKPVTSGDKALVGETKFTVEKEDGEVIVEIPVPAGTYTGTAVVFEQLIDAKTGKVVCVHEDIEDADQTVYFTQLRTQAAFKDGSKKALLTTDQTIADKVTYKGLEPGREYTITGTLINKQTGKVVTSLGKPIETKMNFKPEKTDGELTIELTVPLRTVNGDTVCFEVITDAKTGEIICAHQDINDADQTVNFYNEPKPVTPQTGDTNNNVLWFLLGGFATMVILGAGLLYYRKKKED